MGTKESLLIEIDIIQSIVKIVDFKDRERLNYLIRKLLIEMELCAEVIQAEKQDLLKYQIQELNKLLNTHVKRLQHLTNESPAAEVEKKMEEARISIHANLVATQKLMEG